MHNTSVSILGSLRTLAPHRDVTFDEALRVAELQATRLAYLFAVDEGVQDHHIAALPRFVIAYEDITVSGMSHWNGSAWVITINRSDSAARQRFTLLHEFKHIIDHGQSARLYTGDRYRTTTQQAEAAADYFAGCALVPKRQLKAAWGRRIQQAAALADLFGVSQPAIQVRLAQTGLSRHHDEEPASRCARPVLTPRDATQRFQVPQPTQSRRFA